MCSWLCFIGPKDLLVEVVAGIAVGQLWDARNEMVGSTFLFGTVEIQQRSPILRDSEWEPLKAPERSKCS